jgi:Fe-S cluster assembly iron-binding protein IscA
MVNVTGRAKDRLKTLLTTTPGDPSVGLRLDQTPSGGLAIFPDRERADDQVVEHQGTAVLLVGQDIAPTVDDTTIDCDDSAPDARLVIMRS